MNKFTALTAGLLITATGLVGTAGEALAGRLGSSTYTFNRKIGSVYFGRTSVKRYEVSPGNTNTRITVTYKLPTCGHRYYLKGTVRAKYTSPTGNSTGWLTLGSYDSRVRNYEGQTLTKKVYSSVGLKHAGGRVSVDEGLTCKSLAPLRDVGPNTEKRVRKELNNCLSGGCDPTKGIFW